MSPNLQTDFYPAKSGLRWIILTTVFGWALLGCGQKGPLYLPPPEAPGATAKKTQKHPVTPLNQPYSPTYLPTPNKP